MHYRSEQRNAGDIKKTVIYLKMVSVVVSPFYWSKNRAVLYNHKVYAFYAF